MPTRTNAEQRDTIARILDSVLRIKVRQLIFYIPIAATSLWAVFSYDAAQKKINYDLEVRFREAERNVIVADSINNLKILNGMRLIEINLTNQINVNQQNTDDHFKLMDEKMRGINRYAVVGKKDTVARALTGGLIEKRDPATGVISYYTLKNK